MIISSTLNHGRLTLTDSGELEIMQRYWAVSGWLAQTTLENEARLGWILHNLATSIHGKTSAQTPEQVTSKCLAESRCMTSCTIGTCLLRPRVGWCKYQSFGAASPLLRSQLKYRLSSVLKFPAGLCDVATIRTIIRWVNIRFHSRFSRTMASPRRL
jgi:hypothetical protein